MLEALYKKWDGNTGHIENLLPDYLGVEKSQYSTECMKLFMLGAISRAYKPGCKFDYMPVFVGKQGIGKSTFLRLLSMNNAWYNDNFNTVEGDKAPEKKSPSSYIQLSIPLTFRLIYVCISVHSLIGTKEQYGSCLIGPIVSEK